MNWNTIFLALISMSLFSCISENKSTNTKNTKEQQRTTYFNTEHIIEVDELKKLANKDNIKIIHFGKPANYNRAHIPNAVNIWRTDIEAKNYPYKGMMGSKTQIEILFSRLGISNQDTLLVYDDVASCDSARLWWVLKNYGFENLRILNGGLAAWKEKKGLLTTKQTAIKPTKFKLLNQSPMTSHIAKENLLNVINSYDLPIIIDTRTLNEFTGKRQKKGALSGGRIPNSQFLDWADCMNYNGDKKFKGYTELEAMYKTIIPNKNEDVIVYCHSGVRSAHTLFVLTELLGYKNVRNYDGSWIEWSHFESYPKVKDSVTLAFK